MLRIQTILEACKTVTATDTPTTANRKLMQIAHEYCKKHTFSEDLILIVSIKGTKPLLYSYSYNFSITNLHEQVRVALVKARQSLCADIVVLEWFPSKGTKLPYYVHFI